MAKEQFNPWPSFVDLFSSVILVLILLLLIVLVNLGYYAQFKFKTSYTGSITTDSVILNDNPTINKQDEEVEKIIDAKTIQTKNMEQLVQTIKKLEEQKVILQQQVEVKEYKPYVLESAGSSINKEDSTENQNVVEKEEYFVVTFSGNEIFMDDPVIKRLKGFITNATQKYSGHSVKIFAKDPVNQLSATVAKQISLGRTLSVRNLVRKLGYDKSDVNVDLMGSPNIEEPSASDAGYVVVRIIKK